MTNSKLLEAGIRTLMVRYPYSVWSDPPAEKARLARVLRGCLPPPQLSTISLHHHLVFFYTFFSSIQLAESTLWCLVALFISLTSLLSLLSRTTRLAFLQFQQSQQLRQDAFLQVRRPRRHCSAFFGGFRPELEAPQPLRQASAQRQSRPGWWLPGRPAVLGCSLGCSLGCPLWSSLHHPLGGFFLLPRRGYRDRRRVCARRD